MNTCNNVLNPANILGGLQIGQIRVAQVEKTLGSQKSGLSSRDQDNISEQLIQHLLRCFSLGQNGGPTGRPTHWQTEISLPWATTLSN